MMFIHQQKWVKFLVGRLPENPVPYLVSALKLQQVWSLWTLIIGKRSVLLQQWRFGITYTHKEERICKSTISSSSLASLHLGEFMIMRSDIARIKGGIVHARIKGMLSMQLILQESREYQTTLDVARIKGMFPMQLRQFPGQIYYR